WRKYFVGGSRRRPAATSSRSRGGNRRNAGRALGRGASRICRLRSRRDRDGNRAAQLRARSSGALQVSAENSFRTRAAKNSDGQGQEVCPSRKAAGHFQTVTGLTALQLYGGGQENA